MRLSFPPEESEDIGFAFDSGQCSGPLAGFGQPGSAVIFAASPSQVPGQSLFQNSPDFGLSFLEFDDRRPVFTDLFANRTDFSTDFSTEFFTDGADFSPEDAGDGHTDRCQATNQPHQGWTIKGRAGQRDVAPQPSHLLGGEAVIGRVHRR